MAGRDLHPLKSAVLPRRTPKADIRQIWFTGVTGGDVGQYPRQLRGAMAVGESMSDRQIAWLEKQLDGTWRAVGSKSVEEAIDGLKQAIRAMR